MVNRKHIIRDIRPYSCSFADCSTVMQLYGSRKEWLAHEFKCHRFSSEWLCIKGCGQTFDSETVFHSHLREQHTVGTLDLPELSSKCRKDKPPPPHQQTNCPLCMERVKETRDSLRRHIGHHLEEVALASLPPELYRSDDSSEEDVDEDDIRMEKEEEPISTDTLQWQEGTKSHPKIS